MKRWDKFKPESSGSIMSVADRAVIQGTESRRHWLDGDYLSKWFPRRAQERDEAIDNLRRAGA